MLGIPLVLVLELPPLAFGPALPPAQQMPRELVCAVRDLGKPAPMAALPVPSLPRFTTPKPGRTYLIGPKADHFIFVLGVLAAWATGGTVDTRSLEQKAQDGSFNLYSH